MAGLGRTVPTIRTRTPCIMFGLDREQFVQLRNSVLQLYALLERAADVRQRELAALQ